MHSRAKHRPGTDQRHSCASGDGGFEGFVHVRGAREHNLKNIDVRQTAPYLARFLAGHAKAAKR